MKKKIVIVLIVIVLLVLLVPIPRHLKDGGTIEYKALTYKISKVHKLNDDSSNGYETGTRILLFGKEIYSNVSLEKSENKKEDKQEINEGNKYSTVVNNTLIELTIPNDWKYEEVELKKDASLIFSLKLFKEENKRNVVLNYSKTDFMYCGTARINEELILNSGIKAEVGYYGEEEKSFSDISFDDVDPKIAIIDNGLNEEEVKELLEFVKTLKIENIEEFLMENFDKILEVTDKTSSNPYDYTKNDYYKKIVEIGSSAVSTLESMYKNGKLTGVNAYLSALLIQDITKCNLYDKYGYDWSTAEEFYKLWQNNNCSYKK